mgnify:CR=1 FL=1
MLDTLFRAFFKYEPLVFEQGQFVLGANRSMWLTVAVLAAVAAAAIWTYWQIAVLRGRDFVTPDDVKAVALPVDATS